MGIQSIDRAVAILKLLSQSDEGLPISTICSRLGLALGTAHRFLHSLIDNGLVTQDEKTKFYRIGLEMLRLTSGILNSDRLIETARQPMQAAANKLQNMVYLSRENHGEVICVSCVNDNVGPQMKFAAQIGSDMPFHAAAAGKIIMAYESPERIESLIQQKMPLQKFTENTHVTKEVVMADMHKCRVQGYSVCDEELELGVVAVAAPIRNLDGRVNASVAVTGIKANVVLDDLISIIKKCAEEISKAQGYLAK